MTSRFSKSEEETWKEGGTPVDSPASAATATPVLPTSELEKQLADLKAENQTLNSERLAALKQAADDFDNELVFQSALQEALKMINVANSDQSKVAALKKLADVVLTPDSPRIRTTPPSV